MNGPNTPPPGLLDELLSADIDGELERAAADHGLTLDDARAAITTPEAVGRRAALTQARDLVSPPVPLDPADADRLVTGALDRARDEHERAAARRSRNHFDAARRAAIAAAAIVVVFGGIAVLARGTTSSKSSGAQSSSTSLAGAQAAPSAHEAASPELGDVSTPDALRAKVLQRVPHVSNRPVPRGAATRQSRDNASAKSVTFDISELSAQQVALLSLVGPKGPRGPGIPESTAADRRAGIERPTRADCVGQLLQSGRVPPAPVFSGSGISGGRPVYVAVFRSGSGYAVYVLRATDCSVLRSTVV